MVRLTLFAAAPTYSGVINQLDPRPASPNNDPPTPPASPPCRAMSQGLVPILHPMILPLTSAVQLAGLVSLTFHQFGCFHMMTSMTDHPGLGLAECQPSQAISAWDPHSPRPHLWGSLGTVVISRTSLVLGLFGLRTLLPDQLVHTGQLRCIDTYRTVLMNAWLFGASPSFVPHLTLNLGNCPESTTPIPLLTSHFGELHRPRLKLRRLETDNSLELVNAWMPALVG